MGRHARPTRGGILLSMRSRKQTERQQLLMESSLAYHRGKEGKSKNSRGEIDTSGSVDQVAEDRVHCGLILDDDLDKTLKQFWEIESVDVECTGDSVASLCEDLLVLTHKRNKEGRYVISMTLSRDPSCSGNSKDMAVRPLNSFWKRLSRDSECLSLYTDFLRKYEDLGHLERVVESSEPPTQYYILRHDVLRLDKLTTKLRVVFNASSPTPSPLNSADLVSRGLSLRDLPELKLWWSDPSFLERGELSNGPRPPLMNESEYSCELKTGVVPEMPISSVYVSRNCDLSFLSDLMCMSLEEGGGLITAGESSKSSDMSYSKASSSDKEEELISASASDSGDCKTVFLMEGEQL
ncbi:hypothetical protein AVEN_240381-1 [Araneus ventricosus]|uniref:Uncharacterized protein n=1 Tax=Araneus ventricosus TaxID=182803 RepID=A0A4Y2F4J1_ARAVE|nr:hypothetical protein AVEN_240381-1 [Araneus ventricosus]